MLHHMITTSFLLLSTLTVQIKKVLNVQDTLWNGWMASTIAQDFTVDNVKRVAYATAQWVKNEAGKTHAYLKPAIVLAAIVDLEVKCFCLPLCKSWRKKEFMPRITKALPPHLWFPLGLMTSNALLVSNMASHNPPAHSGYKLKSFYGGPTKPDDVALVESHILDHIVDVPNGSLASYVHQGM